MKINFNKKINKRNNISFSYLKSFRNINTVIETRFNILIFIILISMFIILGNLFYIQVYQTDKYIKEVEILNENTILGSTAPRGRIYDRNHNLIVDNKPSKIIYYKKSEGLTLYEEATLALQLSEIIEVDYSKLTDKELKNFYIVLNDDEVNNKITDKEWESLSERKITSSDIYNLKIERITDEELKETNKEAAYIYTLMNEGYSYSEKIIKKDNITDEEYALISEKSSELNGVNTRLDWEREYIYGDTFKSMLGTVSSTEIGVPEELKEEYLAKGYTLNDRVGTSYIEYQYEEYLRGEKNIYEVDDNKEYKLVEEGSRGKDIVLTIDIQLQQEVERIIEENLIKAKEEPNTEYFNRAFVIISDPQSGEILAMSGKQIVEKNDGYEIYDYTPGITTSPVVVGSSIKGASHIVGYNTGAITYGEVRNDACIKIAATPEKCSWKYLGNLNDITALKHSSNTYQFHTAIEVGNGNYSYNSPLALDPKAFDTYRTTFNEFGLGVKTEIDLPVESLGYIGTSVNSGHLLDFSIGQYDTYTPIQLSQYINTIANGGNRLQPQLLKEVYNPTKDGLTDLYYTQETVLLNTVTTEQSHLDRVEQGFIEVMNYGGTASGFMSRSELPAGKTGTSQSFVDSDNDGKIDKETITNTFVGYAPYDNPTVSFTVISPDTYNFDNDSDYQSLVNMRITQEVSKKFFELY